MRSWRCSSPVVVADGRSVLASVDSQVSTISGYLEGDTCPEPAFPQVNRYP